MIWRAIYCRKVSGDSEITRAEHVIYGMADWPSYSYWIVPGTVEER